MRRFLKIISYLATGALLALLALPWWLGPALRGVAAHYRTTFSRYERIGYGRFALHDVTVDLPAVRVTVGRAEYATPMFWLARRLSGKPAKLLATTWHVEVKPRATAAAVTATLGRDGGAMPLRAILAKVATGLDRWLPRAEIGAGDVTWPGGGLHLTAATWQNRAIEVRQFRLGALAADGRANFAADGTIELEAKSDAQAWRASFKNRNNEITGEAHLWDQPVIVKSRFAAQGWMPAEAEVRADHWSVPGTRLKLGQFYSAVRGDARIEWREGKFAVSAEAVGDAIPERNAPPLTAQVRGHGDGEALTIESLAVDLPGVSASLSAPAVLDRRGQMKGGASRFLLTVDLEKQPWFTAKGKMVGEAQLTPRPDRAPLIEVGLSAREVALPDWAIARFSGAAEFDWPRLNLKQAEFGFAEGGQLAVHGEWNFETKEVRDAVAEGVVRPSLVARWLPKNVGFESITIAAKASGPLAALVHEGQGHVSGLTVPMLKTLTADVAWQGKGAALTIDGARLQAGNSQIEVAGTLDAAGAQVTKATLSTGDTVRLALAHSAAVRWSPKFEIGALALAGEGASLGVTATLGETGRMNLTLRDFPSAWLADFVALPGPEWRLVSLATEGDWDRGALAFKTEGELVLSLAAERLATIALRARGDKQGVQIESLRVAEGAASIVTATGRMPVTLHPETPAFVQIDRNGPLALHATTASNPAFWKKLSETTGLEFDAPEATLELSGTWAKPQGELRAKAARFATDEKRIKLPVSSVETLDLHVVADRAGLTVDRFSARIEGQAVRASGKLAFTPEQWPTFKADPIAFLRERGSVHVEVPDAEFAAVARHFPEFLTLSGRLHVDATVAPGGDMQGTLTLSGAATRPLGGIGVLQEIQGEARLAGNVIEVRSLTARSGGQPVTLSGRVELPMKSAPKYDFTLKGENLPLVRQTGLLVRADVDLKLTTAGDGSTGSRSEAVPTIAGAVKLRDSMFLSDLRAFIPRGGGGAPTRRPPYFAIESPPLNAWRLNVDVQGEKFMRLRSTLFTGTASARFNLGGTLGVPHLVGEATVDAGVVTLPFAAFKLDEAAVRVTEANPNSLQLFAAGRSRRYGYDLRMEATGTADAPVIVFSSSPALEAKQVLLMVMAGELPNDEITYGGAQRAARLGTYLGQSLITSFGGDPSDAGRLTIMTGERVSSLGRETYEAEYRLTDRFTLVGEYDEYDAYNTGVKWSVRPPEDPVKASVEPPVAAKKEAATRELPH